MDSEKHLILYIFDLENDAVVAVLLSQEVFFPFLYVCVCCLMCAEENSCFISFL